MSPAIVFVAGSPSLTSRSSTVAQAIALHVKDAGFATRSFSVRDFEPTDVLLGQAQSAGVRDLLAAIRGAAAVVLSSPVYKASYSGALKAVVDLVPPDDLAGKPVLGIATTRLAAHGSAVDSAYRALFAFFRAHPGDTLVVFDDELDLTAEQPFAEDARARVAGAARALATAARASAPGAAARG